MDNVLDKTTHNLHIFKHSYCHRPLTNALQWSMVMVTFLLLNDSHKAGNNGEDFKPSSEFSKHFSTGFFPSGRLRMKSSLS